MNKTRAKYLDPVHPGEILRLEFMEPLGLSQNKLARDIQVPPRRVNEIIHGKRAVTADTAVRLGLYFDMTPQFWLNLQTRYELDCIKQAERDGKTLFSKIKAFKSAVAMI